MVHSLRHRNPKGTRVELLALENVWDTLIVKARSLWLVCALYECMVDSLVVSAQLILAWICISLAECVMTCEPGQVKAPELVDPATRMAALQKQKEALEQESLREREELLGTMVTLLWCHWSAPACSDCTVPFLFEPHIVVHAISSSKSSSKLEVLLVVSSHNYTYSYLHLFTYS